MSKQLSEMTDKELGQLFPIQISEPNPEWRRMYQAEKIAIVNALGEENILRIEHIGSTAIPNLKAKPTIDMLLEIPESTHNNLIKEKLTMLNYHFIPQPENPPPHMMFAKGYTLEGFKGQAYHIHVRYKGDWDELYFRDYLIAHPEIACHYSDLKSQLVEKYKYDREEYTDKKTEFIKRITQLAREE